MGQSLASTQWYVYGRRHFRQSGYHRHIQDYYGTTVMKNNSGNGNTNSAAVVQSRADIGVGEKGADGVDLTNKVVVITGANSGLGKEMATYASAKGAKLYMICRSKDRAEQARQEIVSKTANENVKVVLADVGELEQVRNAAKEIQSKESNIHCLVCNAGVLLNDKQVTSEGHEATFASHLLGGSYLLTKLLLPQLRSASKCKDGDGDGDGDGDANVDSDEATCMNMGSSRVIYVTSGGMLTTNFPSWEVATNTGSDLTYDGTMTYAYAKRGQVILAEEMTKQHTDVKFVSAHPGWVDTKAVDDAFGRGKVVLEPMRNTWEGAEGITWLMSASSDRLESGGFYLDRLVQQKHIAGPFMREGTFTKNSESEIHELMDKLENACST